MKRTLVWRGGALGDFLLTLPALASLEIEHLTLVTRPAYSGLMLAGGWTHEFVNLESAHLAALFSSAAVLPRDLQSWLAGFDHIYAWLTDADGHCHHHLTAAAAGKFTLLNPVVSAVGPHASVQLATGLAGPLQPFYWPSLPAVQRIPERIALHPGSGSPSKNRPLSAWLETMTQLARSRPNISFLIITGEADEAAHTTLRISLETAPWPIIWAHHWPLSALLPALLACESYSGHDTGITHLAASLGLLVHVYFRSTDPQIWEPLGKVTLCAENYSSFGSAGLDFLAPLAALSSSILAFTAVSISA